MPGLMFARKLSVQLRRMPGTYPLLNAVRKRSYRAGCVVISDFDGSMRMRLDLSEHMASQIFWFGYYSRDVLRVIGRLLGPGDTMFDVGANIGEVTLFAAKRVGEAGRVLAFEPIHSLASRLRANLNLNRFDQVEVVEMAVADRAGQQPLYVQAADFEDGSRHDGLGTLYASPARAHVADHVEVTTMDEFVRANGIARIDGIKLDIEGAELPALQGAIETLKRFRPWLILEIDRQTSAAAGYRAEELIALLTGLDYEGFLIGRKGKLRPLQPRDLGIWQNALFICRQKEGEAASGGSPNA